MTEDEETAAGDEAALRARFDVREERFRHGGWEASLIVPRAADALIDEARFDDDERLPYWAELWPSARALARHLLDAPPVADGALELGCGIALPSLALRRAGAEVLATDWDEDALRFAEANAVRNGLAPLRTALLDWRAAAPPGGFALVVAADVLYERRNGDALAEILPRVVAPAGRFLLADPGRTYLDGFLRALGERGWAVREVERRREASSSASGTASEVRIVEARRGA